MRGALLGVALLPADGRRFGGETALAAEVRSEFQEQSDCQAYASDDHHSPASSGEAPGDRCQPTPAFRPPLTAGAVTAAFHALRHFGGKSERDGSWGAR